MKKSQLFEKCVPRGDRKSGRWEDEVKHREGGKWVGQRSLAVSVRLRPPVFH